MGNFRSTTLLVIACVCAFGSQESGASKIFSGLFPNWARYRPLPYKFIPEDLQGIIGRLDHLIYAHAHFTPEDYQVKFTDPQDEDSVRKLTEYKESHPHIKILVSVGGEHFPSSHFSNMVSSNQSIAEFVDSLRAFLEENMFDGVDIGWRWPCSLSKMIFTRRYQDQWLTCDTYQEVFDSGSTCPDDGTRLLYLLKGLREGLGNRTLITVTGSPDPNPLRHLPLGACSEYVDYWHVESFGYTVSATNSSYLTAPLAPLTQPPFRSGVNALNINTTVMAYLKAGVAAEKLILGISLHGSLWYVKEDEKWQEFGIRGRVQGKCCGPYRSTFGAKPGRGSQTCGLYMYSEIQVLTEMEYYYDQRTQTAIGYMRRNSSSDGWTEAGTWLSYSDRNSIQAITQYIKKNGLAGVYVSDVSADTINHSSKEFTFELMGVIYSGIQGGGEQANVCNPTVGCNVCTTCCRSYLTNQFDCDACVTIKCRVNICYPHAICNVCSQCCSEYHKSQGQCNFCVENKC